MWTESDAGYHKERRDPMLNWPAYLSQITFAADLAGPFCANNQ
jgi:hypothetical protein